MYRVTPYNIETGDIYDRQVTTTCSAEYARWLEEQYTARGIGCVVRDINTGAEW